MLLRSLSPIPAWRWTTFVVLILSLVSAVSLGFAFPANLSDAAVASGQADIFLSAKFEFLVGLLLVDVPFLAIRVYWMLVTEKVYWFVLKNVFSIFVRPLKLNQCRLAERERAKGTQRTIYEAPPTVRQHRLHKEQQDSAAAAEGKQQQQPQQQQNAAASAAAAVGRGVLSNIQRLRQRGSMLRQRKQGGAAAELNRTDVPSAQSSREFDSSLHPGSSLGSDVPLSSSDASSDREEGEWPRRRGPAIAGVIAAAVAAAAAADAPQKLSRRQRALVRDLNYSRRFPVSGIGCGNALQRLLVLLFRCRGRGLSGLLDGDTYLSYAQQLRFAVGGLLLILSRMLLVVFGFWCFFFDDKEKDEFPEFFPVVSWHAMAKTDRALGILIAVSVFVCFSTSACTVPFWDCILSSCCFGVQQISRGLLYRVFGFRFLRPGAVVAGAAAGAAGGAAAAGNALEAARIVVSAGPRFAVWLILSLCFLALPVCDLLTAWAYVPLSLCGKRFFSLSRDKRVKETSATSMPLQPPEAGGRVSPSLVYLSLSNAVIFSLCRQGAAPLSLQALLVGPDTMKGLRLSEALLEAFSLDLALAAVFRLWALCEHLSWFNFCVFGGHLLVGLLYLLLSQAARSLSLRRYEVLLTVEDLIRHRTDDLSIFDEGDSSGDELQQQQQQRLKGGRTTTSSFITCSSSNCSSSNSSSSSNISSSSNSSSTNGMCHSCKYDVVMQARQKQGPQLLHEHQQVVKRSNCSSGSSNGSSSSKCGSSSSYKSSSNCISSCCCCAISSPATNLERVWRPRGSGSSSSSNSNSSSSSSGGEGLQQHQHQQEGAGCIENVGEDTEADYSDCGPL
ncbi:hypothetical protein ACSSS7_005201 [Eimeria intestinalis]